MIARRRLLGILAALGTLGAGLIVQPTLTAGASVAAAQKPGSSHLVLAVVRNDGILLPFAAFTGRKWLTPWPALDAPGSNVELPVRLDAVPRRWWGGEDPGAWQLWTRNAETPIPLTLSSLAMVPIGLSRQVGFRTSLPPVPPLAPPFEMPFPKMGVAIAGNVPMTPIATVSPRTPAHKNLAVRLEQPVNKAEEDTIRALRGAAHWTHPFTREMRARVPLALEAWYVTTIGAANEQVSYVEAAKKYPLLPQDDGCGLETFVSGWVYSDETGHTVDAKLKAVVTYCDRRGVSYLLPFGQIRVNDRIHWIVQTSGHDHEWYAVVEARPGRIRYVAEYRAGWTFEPR